MELGGILLGRKLSNREFEHRRIGAFEAVPDMGLDGLGSAAYGPEAALTILAPVGAASLGFVGWVMGPVVALLALLYLSYRQTVVAYPNSGGAYTVAKENLGVNASLLAAAAIMIDYVLNVAVGVSAGVGALVSSVPSLQRYTLPICLGVLAFTTVVNLRGTPDAGRLFALPTYLFILSFLLLMGIGVVHAMHAGGRPQAVVPVPPLAKGTEALTLWLLLRAFAAGCTAMTGVEAVSNGVGVFKEPRTRYAHRTLSIIVGVLGLLLVGVSYLVHAYGIGAMDETRPGYQSVLSQLAGAVVGHGVFYYVAMASVLCVLCLSANTSFVGFPQLCRLAAEDGFLPRPFAMAGRRLVYSVGIIYLAATSGVLLIVFGGITDRLIPLFAIGAFLTFTMSQAGMVVHWSRALRNERGRARLAHTVRLTINAVGAAATIGALAIIVTTKFLDGAWITILTIPAVIALLKAISRYYQRLSARVALDTPLDPAAAAAPVVILALEDWNRIAQAALNFALTISPDVRAVHLTALRGPECRDDADDLAKRWRDQVEAPIRAAGRPPPSLVMLEAEYRDAHAAFLNYIEGVKTDNAGRIVAVLVPELIKRPWELLLHANRGRALRERLARETGEGVVMVEVPWRAAETGA